MVPASWPVRPMAGGGLAWNGGRRTLEEHTLGWECR